MVTGKVQFAIKPASGVKPQNPSRDQQHWYTPENQYCICFSFSLFFPLLILYFCNTVEIYGDANKAACFCCSVPLIIYIYEKHGCPPLKSNQETGTTFSEI